MKNSTAPSKWRYSLTALLLAGLLQACGQIDENKAISPTGGTSSTSTGSSVTAGVNAGLYFNVSSAWNTMPNDRTSWITDCSIPLHSAYGTTQLCSVSIPEGQLHYSDLFMTVGSADTTFCKQVQFFPYGHLASNTSGYRQPIYGTATAIDCSVTPTPATCYEGPATALLPTFPALSSLIVRTSLAQQTEYTIPSAWSRNRVYNTWAANYSSTPGIDQNVNSVAYYKSFLYNNPDYLAVCRDEYYEAVYTIAVRIRSIPYPTSGVVSFPGWN